MASPPAARSEPALSAAIAERERDAEPEAARDTVHDYWLLPRGGGAWGAEAASCVRRPARRRCPPSDPACPAAPAVAAASARRRGSTFVVMAPRRFRAGPPTVLP